MAQTDAWAANYEGKQSRLQSYLNTWQTRKASHARPVDFSSKASIAESPSLVGCYCDLNGQEDACNPNQKSHKAAHPSRANDESRRAESAERLHEQYPRIAVENKEDHSDDEHKRRDQHGREADIS